MRIRRLAAGELAGEARARVEAHLESCPRCRAVERELADERARLAAELPFDVLAAGVAERLAAACPRISDAPRSGAGEGAARPRPRWRAAAAVALAAAVLAAIVVPMVRRPSPDDARESGVRAKGGAELAVWVSEGAGEARALAPGEPVPAGAALRVGLVGAPQPFAAVALVDSDGVVVLEAGPTRSGPLPGAFQWVGRGAGTLVAVLDEAPIDPAALADRILRGGPLAAGPGPRAQVLVRPLRRGAP
jgi:hypothetical protein